MSEVTREVIGQVCDEIKDLLVKKNRDYGDSVRTPINVFSQLSARDQVLVRIDDKLKRIQNMSSGHRVSIDEDTVQDLIGYLVLLRVIDRLDAPKEDGKISV